MRGDIDASQAEWVTHTPIDQPGPTSAAERALGPDLARGVMLLFIALANSHYFLGGDTIRGGFPQDGSGADSVVTWFISTFVDGRAFPMFGLLFGYGVAHIARRQAARGPRGVRHLLWRRSAVLILVGFLHAMLLYVGDILAAYGVLLLLGAWAVRWRDRWLVLVAALFFTINVLPDADAAAVSTEPADESMIPAGLASMFSARLVVQPFIMLLGPIGFACPFLIGLWAGRRRLLERPADHRRLLLLTATIGTGLATLGAQPAALLVSGVAAVPSEDVLALIGPLHDASGVLGGFGYAALITLLATRVTTDRHSPVATAVVAAGRRSMTCYLAQSIVWALVFTPFLFDLADHLTVTTTALLATATWVATVVMADRMQRIGQRGPFELLTRRLTYGNQGIPRGVDGG